MKKTLIIVDMQNDFITGSLANPDAQKIVDPICEYLEANKDSFSQVILTRDTHYGDYLATQEGKKLPVEHCIKDTTGWCVHDKILKTIRESKIKYNFVDKPTFGCFGLYLYIDSDGPIEMCGTCTDICVISNALILKAQRPETKLTILSKLCAGVTPELHEAALKVMQSCQCEII